MMEIKHIVFPDDAIPICYGTVYPVVENMKNGH